MDLPAFLNSIFMISREHGSPEASERSTIMDDENLFEPLHDPSDPDDYDDGVEM